MLLAKIWSKLLAYTNKLVNKHSASVEASPQVYLIIAEQRLALNSGDATEINYYPER